MADPLSWTDPTTILGGTGLLAGLGAVIKTVLDWRRDHGGQRVASEDLIRDDMLSTSRDQRIELGQMRIELAAARTEMREQEARHREGLHACEERAERFLEELRHMHSENDALRGRYHRLSNYVAQVRAEVDIDRIERGLKVLPLPDWVDEMIVGPTARPPDKEAP